MPTGRHLVNIMASFSIVLAAAGCGLIVSGTHATINTDTDPQGAEVWMDGVLIGRTPLVTEIDSTEEHDLVFKLDGREMPVKLRRRVMGGAVFMDVLFGLIPLIVDGATGGWYQIGPEIIRVDLNRTKTIQPAGGTR